MMQQEDPWAKYRQGATAQPTAPQPALDPIVKPAPPSERRANRADARAEDSAARQRDQSTFRTLSPEEAASRQLPPDGVYQINALGQINRIANNPGYRSEPIGETTYKETEQQIETLTALERGLANFQDEFGGNPLGGLENRAQSLVDVGTPGQREWWADFSQTDNLIRNRLFGSALSAQEKAAYEDTTVSPAMRPDIIKANLERRAGIIRAALSRRRDFLRANGAREQAVSTLFSPLDVREQNEAADAEAPSPPRFSEGDGNVAGRTRDFGDSTETEGLTQEDYERQDNPALAGIREEYVRRLSEGQDAREIISWARSAGVDPSAIPSIQAQVRFRDENPSVPFNQYDTTQLDDTLVPLSQFDQAVNSAAQSPLGSYFIAAGDAASAFTLDNIIGATGGNAERARLGMNALADQNPVSSALGTVSGGVMAALGAEGALAARGVSAGLGRSAIADSAYGAAAGAGKSDNSNRLAGAAVGAGAGALGSVVGSKVGNALNRAASPASDSSVRAMNEAGVPLTAGQQYSQSGQTGKAIKGLEDRVMDVPIVGEIVKQRRFEGYEKFNSVVFDRALEPIGGNVSGKTGAAAVEDAQKQVSQAFTHALAGKGVLPDEQFGKDLTKSVLRLGSIKRVGDEVKEEVGEVLMPYADEKMLSGEALQDISRSLRDIKHAYRNDPLARRVHRDIDAVERSIFDLFDRQASGTVEAYTKARTAYRRLSVLEDAVLRAKNNDGVFTTGQLGLADRTNSKRYDGKRAAASGKSPFHDIHKAGQDVLPSQVPNSGTAGRLLLPLAGATIIGADTVDGDVGATSLTIGAILAGAYGKRGQALLTAPGRGSENAVSRALAAQPTRRAISASSGASGAAAASEIIGPR